MAPVIVFGPTGNVGSFVARTAEAKGATVYLGMRYIAKAIPGLSREQEEQGRYHRVEADLSKPETLAGAVRTANAERAFIYSAHGSKDHMKSALEALKTAGIKFIVFLSSYTVVGNPRDIEPRDYIAWAHAQVEINLEEIFGLEGYAAARCGGFATNLLRWKKGIVDGNIRLFGGDLRLDCITPESMGTACGTLLAEGPQDGQRVVYLYGPQVITQKDALLSISRIFGKEAKITEIDAAEALEQINQEGMPRPVAEFIVGILSDDKSKAAWNPARIHYEEGIDNVQKYTGKKSVALEDWARANRKLFES